VFTTALVGTVITAQEGESHGVLVVSVTHMAHVYSLFGLLDAQMRRSASGARRIQVYLHVERGRYQDSPTAVPRSALTPDWKGEPHVDDSYSIAPVYEGGVLRGSRVCDGQGEALRLSIVTPSPLACPLANRGPSQTEQRP